MTTSRGSAVVAVLIVAMGVAVIAATGVAAAEASTPATPVVVGPNERFIILIDAGSSGSRVHVHRYTLPVPGNPLPTIQPSLTVKRKPGLSSYADTPAEAGESLRPLVEFAKAHVPERLWHVTPVHVQATAGLRSLPPHKSLAVLEAVRNDLSRSPADGGFNVFAFQRAWARMITGTQEGLNGWMATNYLAGVLQTPSGKVPAPKTFGLVEMGGFSMQVTFVPDDLSAVDPAALTHLTLGGRVYPLYTYSHPTHGLEAAQESFQHAKIDDIEETGNPCFPSGRYHSAVGDYAQCAKWVDSSILDRDSASAKAVCAANTSRGPAAAAAAVAAAAAAEAAVVHRGMSCLFGGVTMPRITTEQFFAIENFYYTAKFYGILESRNPFADLKLHGTKFCSTPWEQLKAQYPTESPGDLQKYCFSSAYLPRMIEYGLGFTAPEQNVRIVREVNGAAIDWALGAVLYEVMAMHSNDENGGAENAAAVGGPASFVDMGDAGGAGHNSKVAVLPDNEGRRTLLLGVVGVSCLLFVGLWWRNTNARQSSLLPGGGSSRFGR